MKKKALKRLRRLRNLTPADMLAWSLATAAVIPGGQVYVYRPPKSGRKALRSFTVEITTPLEPLP